MRHRDPPGYRGYGVFMDPVPAPRSAPLLRRNNVVINAYDKCSFDVIII